MYICICVEIYIHVYLCVGVGVYDICLPMSSMVICEDGVAWLTGDRGAGKGMSKDVCFGNGAGCALCIDGNGYCKPTGGTISVSKVDGIGGLDAYYYLSVMGEVKTVKTVGSVN